MRYWLPNHVHLCMHDGGAVWLNVRTDQYIGQDRAELRGLSSWVAEWPPDDHDGDVSPEEALSVAEQLAAAGLLTRECTGRSASPPHARIARTPFDTNTVHVLHVHERLLAFSRFLQSRMAAHYSLRVRSFECALNSLSTRKNGLSHECNSAEVERARALLALFNDWQLFIFSAKNQCLEHALWLGNFLALYRLGFQFVIGINQYALGYHCWIQMGDWILTGDEPMSLQDFLPIVVM